jgi:hypothetical protein
VTLAALVELGERALPTARLAGSDAPRGVPASAAEDNSPA